MSTFPVSPRFAKMLLADAGSSVPYVIAVVASLSVPDVFMPENHLGITKAEEAKPTDDSDEDTPRAVFSAADRLALDARESRRKAYNKAHYELAQLGGSSDAFKLLAAVLGHAGSTDPDAYCVEYFLRQKALRETQLLRAQLHRLVAAEPGSTLGNFSARLTPPSRAQLAELRRILASSYPDQIALLASASPTPPSQQRNPTRATAVPYLPLMPIAEGSEAGVVYIHPSSLLAHVQPKNLPRWIVYNHLQRSSTAAVGDGGGKVRMHPLTPLPATLVADAARGTPLLAYGKPIKTPVERGSAGTEREAWVVPSLRPPGGSAGLGWPLPAERVLQRKKGGVWRVEEVLSAGSAEAKPVRGKDGKPEKRGPT